MKTAVVFSGAGLSADSGLPTFRDSNGLWENYNPDDVAEHGAWFRNKELVLNFYRDRYNSYMACKPHAGHFALAKLQEKYNVIHVTQNIDSLLEQAGSKNVKHLHGRIDRQKCEWHSEITILDGDVRFGCNYKTISKEPPKLGDLCPHCQGQMRPDVVWFNEAVDFSFDDMRELCKEVKYNDGVFICVGTSAEVYPAAYLVSFFAQVKNKFIIDPAPKKIADYELLEGTAAAKLPELVERLLNEKMDKDMAINGV